MLQIGGDEGKVNMLNVDNPSPLPQEAHRMMAVSPLPSRNRKMEEPSLGKLTDPRERPNNSDIGRFH